MIFEIGIFTSRKAGKRPFKSYIGRHIIRRRPVVALFSVPYR